MATRVRSGEDRAGFAAWLRRHLASQVDGNATQLAEKSKLQVRTCQRLLNGEGGVNSATLTALLRSGMVTGADLEGFADRGGTVAISAAAAARQLYDALVAELANLPPAKRKKLGIAGDTAAQRVDAVQRRLGFGWPHLEQQERRNFMATLMLRVTDEIFGMADPQMGTKFTPGPAISYENWGDLFAAGEGE